MEFYTSSKHKRPIRLCQKTREFAYESLNHKYGLDTDKVAHIDINHIKNYKSLSPLERYNLGVYEIVTKAPVRICDGELLSGSATLSDAKAHMFPVMHNDVQNSWFTGVSHFTADFFEVLEIGMDGIRKKAEQSLSRHTEAKKAAFIKSCLYCIDCMKIWHERYLNELSKHDNCGMIIKNLKQVPFKPARNFYEAMQSVWFCFAFMRLTGAWPGIGRIDALLGKYLKNDLKNGTITLDAAREIMAHFFIKGCEWIDGKPVCSGDSQHYQNIVLSGIDENGNDVTNEVTMLVLDVVEETGISDFPITIRINKNTDEGFIRRIAEVSKLFIDSGIITIAAFISPNNDIREMAANIIGQDDFLEIYVSTPLAECEKRDVKGLYAKARKGEIKNFTGISAPFEAPEHPALELDTSRLSLEESVNRLLELILPKVKR